MKPRDIALAVLTVTIWGFAFIGIRFALDAFTPPQLTFLRFAIAALPAVFIPRPRISWGALLAIGLSLFTFQFLFQFFAFENGMSPGLASIVLQTQAFFTVLLAALMLGDRPSARQIAGMLAALAGLVMIGMTVGNGLTALGLSLTLCSAFSWAAGNVLVKRLAAVEMIELIVWASLVPPLPALALSLALDGPTALPRALMAAPWLSLLSAIYLGSIGTVGAYSIWGSLLRRYPTALVAPFSLLVPCIATVASGIVFAEHFEPLRLAGMASMVAGLAIIVTAARPTSVDTADLSVRARGSTMPP